MSGTILCQGSWLVIDPTSDGLTMNESYVAKIHLDSISEGKCPQCGTEPRAVIDADDVARWDHLSTCPAYEFEDLVARLVKERRGVRQQHVPFTMTIPPKENPDAGVD